MKAAIIKSSELGSNCWLPARFCGGDRCPRVEDCNYPEKATCKAVDAEKAYIKAEADRLLQEAKAYENKKLSKIRKPKAV
jgi:hypothetical protein